MENNQTKKVIYIGFGDERQYIIDYLEDKYYWKPVASDTKSNNLGTDKGDKSSFVLLNSMEIRRSQFDYSRLGDPVPIDADLIESLSKYEFNFLSTVEDATGWNYSFVERRSYYYNTLKFWNTLIHRLKPDLFISFTWPHTSFCYSLYLLCKYHFNIKVIFLDPLPFFNQNNHLIGNSLEKLYEPFQIEYESKIILYPSASLMNYLKNLRAKKSITPDHVIEDNEYSKKQTQQSLIWPFIKTLISIILKRKNNNIFVAWKKNKKPYYLPSSQMNNLEYFLFVKNLRRKNKNLYDSYKAQTEIPEFKKNYIFFAGSYQPEAVTDTNAGVYNDLFLVLDILSSVLPEDWIIYYKEHPFYFEDFLGKGNLMRNKYYYQKVNEYKNIKMIPSHIESFKLIDCAQAVATVSGTVAWEAVVRGKPALSFGSAWYMGCKSIFRINILQDAKDAMEKIVNGWMPDQSDIERYAAAVEKVTVKGMVHRNFNEEIKKCKDPQYEMERIGEALHDQYERYYGKATSEVEI